MAQAVKALFPQARSPSARPSKTAFITISTCSSPSPRKIWKRSKQMRNSRPKLSRPRGSRQGGGASPLFRAGRGLQGGDSSRTPPGPGQPLPPGRFRRPLPRAAPPLHRVHQGLQAHRHRGGLLARRREAPMLQRIYGTAFATTRSWSLPGRIEEAKKRDHRKLGRELDLFTFDDEVGAGPGHLASQGRHAQRPSWRTSSARSISSGGYDMVMGPQIAQDRTLETLRPLRELPREHVLHRRWTGRATASSR